jgi:hypothetical protein
MFVSVRVVMMGVAIVVLLNLRHVEPSNTRFRFATIFPHAPADAQSKILDGLCEAYCPRFKPTRGPQKFGAPNARELGARMLHRSVWDAIVA